MPIASAIWAVIGSLLVRPRMPSVPKNLRVIARALARLANPAPEAGGDRVNPSRQEEEQGPANEGDRTRPGDPARERHKCGLRRPFVPALAHLIFLFSVLSGRTRKRQE